MEYFFFNFKLRGFRMIDPIVLLLIISCMSIRFFTVMTGDNVRMRSSSPGALPSTTAPASSGSTTMPSTVDGMFE